MNCIRYASGYKYQLRRPHSEQIDIYPELDIVTAWITLTKEGVLKIAAGYAWDGATKAFDTADAMRGSLDHDALYQLIRERHLHRITDRAKADEILYRTILEDGMWKPRAWCWYMAVRMFGDPAADPAKASPDECAPSGCECG